MLKVLEVVAFLVNNDASFQNKQQDSVEKRVTCVRRKSWYNEIYKAYIIPLKESSFPQETPSFNPKVILEMRNREQRES